MGVRIEPLRPSDWSSAMSLSARAFFTEPFVEGLFGSDPVTRFAGMHDLYASSARPDGEVALGSYAGAALAGLVRGWPAGECRVCARGGTGERPQDPAAALDWEFQAHVRRAHAPQAEHAWISQVVIEPTLQGLGIGRAMVNEMVAHLCDRGAALVLLECQDHRVPFYESLGWQAGAPVPDPTGADARLMAWRP